MAENNLRRRVVEEDKASESEAEREKVPNASDTDDRATIGDDIGKEIIAKYDVKVDSKDQFYTDSNGRQMMLRRRNFRPTWNLNLTEPVSANYYPINSRIFVRDDKNQATVLTDRSQGGSSMGK